MKPMIGVTTELDSERYAKLEYPYVKAIEACGGIPLILPYACEEATLERLIELCDGFFFTGGHDIDPARYGETVKETCGARQYHRDDVEFRLFEKVKHTNKPLLGVCRGAQFLNVALGGTLYQDIPSEVVTTVAHRQSEEKFCPSHEVQIVEDTPLYALQGRDRMPANSFHHQAVKTLGGGLNVMAKAADGVIEAVYHTGERYIRAYQWHPERLMDVSRENRAIFVDFIKACLEARQ